MKPSPASIWGVKKSRVMMVLLRVAHCFFSVSSLDKTSVREEIGRLKADFDGLSAEGKVSAEIQAIMNSLFMIIELILAVFLERTTQKNDKNSSVPSSQTDKDESALGRSGSNEW